MSSRALCIGIHVDVLKIVKTLICLSAILMTAFISCTKVVSHQYWVTYCYFNRSGVELVMEIYGTNSYREFKIDNEDSAIIGPINTDGVVAPFAFQNARTDSVVVKYENERTMKYTVDKPDKSERTLFYPNWYMGYEDNLDKRYDGHLSIRKLKGRHRYNKHHFTLSWIFTPEDLNNAKPIE
ncbi:MAG: hypothetical protein OXC03_11175 [Flavobacteriaceae bacterium]|nr:hypothetical protein [Flavobacteriaceae bacterium]